MQTEFMSDCLSYRQHGQGKRRNGTFSYKKEGGYTHFQFFVMFCICREPQSQLFPNIKQIHEIIFYLMTVPLRSQFHLLQQPQILHRLSHFSCQKRKNKSIDSLSLLHLSKNMKKKPYEHNYIDREKFILLKESISAKMQKADQYCQNLNITQLVIVKQEMLNQFLSEFFKEISKQCKEKGQILSFIWNSAFNLIQKVMKMLISASTREQKEKLGQLIENHKCYQEMLTKNKEHIHKKQEQLRKQSGFISQLIYNLRYKKKQVRRLSKTVRLCTQKLNQFKNIYLQLQIEHIDLLCNKTDITKEQALEYIRKREEIYKAKMIQYKIKGKRKEIKSKITGQIKYENEHHKQAVEGLKQNMLQEYENKNNSSSAMLFEDALDIFAFKVQEKQHQQEFNNIKVKEKLVDSSTDMIGFTINLTDHGDQFSYYQRLVNEQAKNQYTQTVIVSNNVIVSVHRAIQATTQQLKKSELRRVRVLDKSYLIERQDCPSISSKKVKILLNSSKIIKSDIKKIGSLQKSNREVNFGSKTSIYNFYGDSQQSDKVISNEKLEFSNQEVVVGFGDDKYGQTDEVLVISLEQNQLRKPTFQNKIRQYISYLEGKSGQFVENDEEQFSKSALSWRNKNRNNRKNLNKKTSLAPVSGYFETTEQDLGKRKQASGTSSKSIYKRQSVYQHNTNEQLPSNQQVQKKVQKEAQKEVQKEVQSKDQKPNDKTNRKIQLANSKDKNAKSLYNSPSRYRQVFRQNSSTVRKHQSIHGPAINIKKPINLKQQNTQYLKRKRYEEDKRQKYRLQVNKQHQEEQRKSQASSHTINQKKKKFLNALNQSDNIFGATARKGNDVSQLDPLEEMKLYFDEVQQNINQNLGILQQDLKKMISRKQNHRKLAPSRMQSLCKIISLVYTYAFHIEEHNRSRMRSLIIPLFHYFRIGYGEIKRNDLYLRMLYFLAQTYSHKDQFFIFESFFIFLGLDLGNNSTLKIGTQSTSLYLRLLQKLSVNFQFPLNVALLYTNTAILDAKASQIIQSAKYSAQIADKVMDRIRSKLGSVLAQFDECKQTIKDIKMQDQQIKQIKLNIYKCCQLMIEQISKMQAVVYESYVPLAGVAKNNNKEGDVPKQLVKFVLSCQFTHAYMIKHKQVLCEQFCQYLSPSQSEQSNAIPSFFDQNDHQKQSKPAVLTTLQGSQTVPCWWMCRAFLYVDVPDFSKLYFHALSRFKVREDFVLLSLSRRVEFMVNYLKRYPQRFTLQTIMLNQLLQNQEKSLTKEMFNKKLLSLIYLQVIEHNVQKTFQIIIGSQISSLYTVTTNILSKPN